MLILKFKTALESQRKIILLFLLQKDQSKINVQNLQKRKI
jgi:hypothetical protein